MDFPLSHPIPNNPQRNEQKEQKKQEQTSDGIFLDFLCWRQIAMEKSSRKFLSN